MTKMLVAYERCGCRAMVLLDPSDVFECARFHADSTAEDLSVREEEHDRIGPKRCAEHMQGANVSQGVTAGRDRQQEAAVASVGRDPMAEREATTPSADPELVVLATSVEQSGANVSRGVTAGETAQTPCGAMGQSGAASHQGRGGAPKEAHKARGGEMKRITLGQVVKDVITGFTGVVTGRVEYLTGCTQVLVQPRVDIDGKLIDSAWMDESRMEIVTAEPLRIDVPAGNPGSDKPAPRC